MQNIVIIGTGGFAREVAWLIEDINKESKRWNLLGFVDETLEVGTKINGYEVIGDTKWLIKQEVFVVIAIGNSLIRKNIINELVNSNNKYATLIHPSVIMSDSNEIGEGTIICAGTIITVNVKIGKHVIINLHSTIGHEAIIENFVTILPGVNISGNVKIEQCANIGTGTAIIQGIKIGSNTIVGAGAVVVKDIPSDCTAVGSPAKPIKFNN